jgi:hypothetical protein
MRSALTAVVPFIQLQFKVALWQNEAKFPCIFNAGISSAGRAIFLTLPPIPEVNRRPEAELWREFDIVRPFILGALLDAVVHGLRAIDQVQLDALPRMADFARWAAACEPALWPAGTFWSGCALSLIVRAPDRPSRPNSISISSIRRNVCARRSRPARARTRI